MTLGKKSDSSINYSTNSSPANPSLDSPITPEDSKDLLSPNDELESSELLTDTSKKKKRGFPVVGCLTIFLGICTLGFLTLPSFLSCANKAKQSEAKTYVGSMNRSQQAYYLENDAFSNSFAALGLGISEQTSNFQYSTRATKTAAFNYGIPRRDYVYETERFGPFQWQKKTDISLKSYVGGVFLIPATKIDPKADKKEIITLAIMCESVSPGTSKPADPIFQNGDATCSAGTKDLRRP